MSWWQIGLMYWTVGVLLSIAAMRWHPKLQAAARMLGPKALGLAIVLDGFTWLPLAALWLLGLLVQRVVPREEVKAPESLWPDIEGLTREDAKIPCVGLPNCDPEHGVTCHGCIARRALAALERSRRESPNRVAIAPEPAENEGVTFTRDAPTQTVIEPWKPPRAGAGRPQGTRKSN